MVCVKLGPVVILQHEERREHLLEVDRRLGQLASFVQQKLEAKMVGGLKQSRRPSVCTCPVRSASLDFSWASALQLLGRLGGLEFLESSI